MIRRATLTLIAAICTAASFAAVPITPDESASVARALAGVWSEYFTKRGDLSDTPSKNQFIDGVHKSLSAADSTDAFYQGVETGVLINTRLKEIEKLGDMKIDRNAFVAELKKAIDGEKIEYTPDSGNAFMEDFMVRRQRRDNYTILGEQMLDSVAALDGVIKTPSGLLFQVITEGEGESPKPDDVVLLDYVGKLPDGKIFDGTKTAAEQVPLPDVIPGFREGVTMMKPGGTYRLFIPANLGYGMYGVKGYIPGNTAITFEISLKKII